MKRRVFLKRSARLASAAGAVCLLCNAGRRVHSRSVLSDPAATHGPLQVHPDNRRYFADSRGRAICLTGSHLGWELQDDSWDKPIVFDFPAYLNLLTRHRHNLIRLWMVEHTRSSNRQVKTAAKPMPYRRSGPGKALDGLPKFNLTKFDQNYFRRVRTRVQTAGRRGIYVMVMLFQGWSLRSKNAHHPWFGHYFNTHNNINGVDGDRGGDGRGTRTHTLAIRHVTELQEAYVRKVIDTVNDLDNVLYEIANESLGSREWHEHMVDVVHQYQRMKANRHPVVVSGCRRGLNNEDLNTSRAEAIGVTSDDDVDYLADPPAADGRHVVIADSDHIKPNTKNPAFVWKNFLRGNHPLVLDWGLTEPQDKTWLPIRRAMGRVQVVAEKVNLAATSPHNELSSTAFCLANPGTEYLVYVPGDSVSVDLSAADVRFQEVWYHSVDDRSFNGGRIVGGARRQLTSPLAGPVLLHLNRDIM